MSILDNPKSILCYFDEDAVQQKLALPKSFVDGLYKEYPKIFWRDDTKYIEGEIITGSSPIFPIVSINIGWRPLLTEIFDFISNTLGYAELFSIKEILKDKSGTLKIISNVKYPAASKSSWNIIDEICYRLDNTYEDKSLKTCEYCSYVTHNKPLNEFHLGGTIIRLCNICAYELIGFSK
jgi:hypothetical protein